MIETLEKLPPHSIEAEQSLLGSLLLDRDAIIKVAPFLRVDDFYREAHARIFEAILDLYNRREPPDITTIYDELARRGYAEQVGGANYLTWLMNAVPTSVHVEYYGRIVEHRATLRRLIEAGSGIAGLGYEEDLEIGEALDRAEQTLYKVAQRRSGRDFVTLRDALAQFFDRLDYLHQHRGEIVGVPTGFHDLDQLTGGLQRSDLVIIAARPSVGKTAFALSLAASAAIKHNQPVGIFSLEMSAEQLVLRLLAMETGIDSHRLRMGYLDEDEWGLLTQAFGRLAEAPVYIDDTAGASSQELRSKARRLHAQAGVDLIMIDYLQLMQGGRTDNRVQEISEISRGLKGLARELNVPVIALSQLSRAVEQRQDHKPMLSDLRESGCLTGDTSIYLPDTGGQVRLDSLTGMHGFRVLALNPTTWRLEPREVTNTFSTGRKQVYRLTTRLGRSIRATGNHKFLAFDGWTRLDRLPKGARIALPRVLPEQARATMRRDELALLGHLIGDGCVLARHATQYTTREPELARLVARLASSVFGAEIRPRVARERTWYQVYLAAGARLARGRRNPVAAWLDGLGVGNLRSHEKRVPEQVFRQPRAEIGLFLRHLWATDGCIYYNADASVPVSVYYASSSERLARDVQSLLLRLGINAVLTRSAQPGKGRGQYHVQVMGKRDLDLFSLLVGAVGERRTAALDAIRAHQRARVGNTNRDVIPRAAWRSHVVPAMQRTGMTTRAMHTAIQTRYCGTSLYKANMGRERAARVAAAVDSHELARLAQSDVYWDEVISIEPDGEEEVYDLTVDGLHNFVADGVVVHNSIEQDADVVMFIYREELYNPQTDKKNIAEIHVSKHRNGPVGIVPLRFFRDTTRFADLESMRQPE